MATWKRKTRLTYWRKMRGLTQEELAKKLGVTGKTIRNWELDITTPGRTEAEALGRLLKISVRELFPHTLF